MNYLEGKDRSKKEKNYFFSFSLVLLSFETKI